MDRWTVVLIPKLCFSLFFCISLHCPLHPFSYPIHSPLPPLPRLHISLSLHLPLHGCPPLTCRVPASTSVPPAPAPAPPAPPNPEPSPRGSGAADGGRLSSDEGDGETPEDTARPAFYSSNHHPQPLGVSGVRPVFRRHS